MRTLVLPDGYPADTGGEVIPDAAEVGELTLWVVADDAPVADVDVLAQIASDVRDIRDVLVGFFALLGEGG